MKSIIRKQTIFGFFLIIKKEQQINAAQSYMKNPHEKPETIFYLNYLLKSNKPRKILF